MENEQYNIFLEGLRIVKSLHSKSILEGLEHLRICTINDRLYYQAWSEIGEILVEVSEQTIEHTVHIDYKNLEQVIKLLKDVNVSTDENKNFVIMDKENKNETILPNLVQEIEVPEIEDIDSKLEEYIPKMDILIKKDFLQILDYLNNFNDNNQEENVLNIYGKSHFTNTKVYHVTKSLISKSFNSPFNFALDSKQIKVLRDFLRVIPSESDVGIILNQEDLIFIVGNSVLKLTNVDTIFNEETLKDTFTKFYADENLVDITLPTKEFNNTLKLSQIFADKFHTLSSIQVKSNKAVVGNQEEFVPDGTGSSNTVFILDEEKEPFHVVFEPQTVIKILDVEAPQDNITLHFSKDSGSVAFGINDTNFLMKVFYEDLDF